MTHHAKAPKSYSGARASFSYSSTGPVSCDEEISEQGRYPGNLVITVINSGSDSDSDGQSIDQSSYLKDLEILQLKQTVASLQQLLEQAADEKLHATDEIARLHGEAICDKIISDANIKKLEAKCCDLEQKLDESEKKRSRLYSGRYVDSLVDDHKRQIDELEEKKRTVIGFYRTENRRLEYLLRNKDEELVKMEENYRNKNKEAAEQHQKLFQQLLSSNDTVDTDVESSDDEYKVAKRKRSYRS